jgi:hypothetical protein
MFALPRTVNIFRQLSEFDHALMTLRLQYHPDDGMPAHVCGPQCNKKPHFLWSERKHQAYFDSLSKRVDAQSFLSCLEEICEDPSAVDRSHALFIEMVPNAAQPCGMWRLRCPLQASSGKVVLPQWFDGKCKSMKKRLQEALYSHIPHHLYQQLKKEYHNLTRRKKRCLV